MGWGINQSTHNHEAITGGSKNMSILGNSKADFVFTNSEFWLPLIHITLSQQ
jgi:hypothetical protein